MSILAIGLSSVVVAAAGAEHATSAVATSSLEIAHGARLPVDLSLDWSTPLPDIDRAVIVVHGLGREADHYYRYAIAAQVAAGANGAHTLVIAPQFLARVDAETFGVPANILRWRHSGWEGGEDAIAPTPISSFQALDAILVKLADRRVFPNLAQVVLAGHSGGGQLVQRYAIVGRSGDTLVERGVGMRYVVANPSSYAYFTADRPVPTSAQSCPRFNQWKYGMEDRPAYAKVLSPPVLEQRYVARRVIYLVGTRDTNPDHAVLDKSCMAEAEGPDRWSRGHFYVDIMKTRDGGTPNHSLWDVSGVAHNAGKMFNSPCGLTALFDVPGCATK